MTLQQAEAYLREYQQLLAEDPRRGSRRNPNLLPTSKDNLLRAIKLLMAQLYYINADTEEMLKPLIDAALFVDSFSEVPFDTMTFIGAMQQRRAELQEFQLDLRKVDRTTRFFWQRVYALTGVTFETRRTTFIDNLKLRFGVGVRNVAPPAASAARPGAVRFSLD
jgi:hypothetical protein